jgi:hypothetical protein
MTGESANDLEEIKLQESRLNSNYAPTRIQALKTMIGIANKEAEKNGHDKIEIKHPRMDLPDEMKFDYYFDNYYEKTITMLDKYGRRSSTPIFKARAIRP